MCGSVASLRPRQQCRQATIQDASKSLVVKIRNIVGAAHLAPLKTSRGTLWTLLESSKQNDLEIENQAVAKRRMHGKSVGKSE